MTTADAETGSKLGDQAIFVSDIVDRANVPDAKMTVAFARVGNREPLDISFPYDYLVASVSQVERQTTEMDDKRTSAPARNSRLLSAEDQACPHPTQVRSRSSRPRGRAGPTLPAHSRPLRPGWSGRWCRPGAALHVSGDGCECCGASG
jgi:hypothetical protein